MRGDENAVQPDTAQQTDGMKAWCWWRAVGGCWVRERAS